MGLSKHWLRSSRRRRRSCLPPWARAVRDLERAKPSRGFLGIQVGETDTAERLDAVLQQLRKDLSASTERTSQWLAAKREALGEICKAAAGYRAE
jgi:hypothetical protein